MQCSPHDIKEQLVRALDQDHNVVDMVAVLKCISILESFPIRREDLEKTRLGRVINELRRKTSDVNLQKRAKDLVRSWRKLLPENPNISAVVQKTAPIPPLSHAQTPRVAQLQQSVVSTIGGRTTSPALSSSNSPVLRTRNGSSFKPVDPAIPGSPSPSAVAPLASHPGGVPPTTPASVASRAPNRNSVANKRLRKDSPPNSVAATAAAAKRSRVSTPTTTAASTISSSTLATAGAAALSNLAESGATTTTTATSNGFDSLLNCNSSINATTATPTTASAAVSTAPASGIPSGNSAFESLVRPDSRTGSVHSDDATSNGGFPSSTPRIVPKVKTTQQLIDELKAKSGINVSIDGVVKEAAPPKRNSVTPGVVSAAKGRRGRPPLHGSRVDSPTGPNSNATTNNSNTPLGARHQAAVNNANFNKLLMNDARELSRTKSELMDRFLQSSPQSHSDESNHPQENGHAAATGLTNGSVANGTSASGTPMMNIVDIEDDIRRIMAQLPPITNSGELLREFEEPKQQEQLFPPRTSAPTEEEVERISNGHWPCVNGNYDMNGQWRPWNQMMMAQSVGSEPLPVLPYVDIEW